MNCRCDVWDPGLCVKANFPEECACACHHEDDLDPSGDWNAADLLVMDEEPH